MSTTLWLLVFLRILIPPVLVVGVVILVVRYLKKHATSLPNAGQGSPAPSPGPPSWLVEIQNALQPQDPVALVMQQLSQIIQQAQAMNVAPGPNAPSPFQAQFNAQVLRMNQRMRDYDRLAQDRLDTSRASMLSDAAAAGIDVSGW